MKRYLLEIQYNGTQYSGWQFQKDKKTIQGCLEEKISIIMKEEIKLYVAGRTDAGVHARQQFAHAEIFKIFDIKKALYSINSMLKEEQIVVLSMKQVNSDFHARFSCKHKEYIYYFLASEIDDVFQRGLYWKIHKFDINLANQGAKYILGTHDFTSFKDAQCQALNPIRTITNCIFEQEGNFIKMKIEAKSFLHHQVRIIAGTLFEVAIGKIPPCGIKEILNKKNRAEAGVTAPAKGLFLNKIIY